MREIVGSEEMGLWGGGYCKMSASIQHLTNTNQSSRKQPARLYDIYSSIR